LLVSQWKVGERPFPRGIVAQERWSGWLWENVILFDITWG